MATEAPQLVFISAAQSGDAAVTSSLLQLKTLNPNTPDEHGFTALIWAAAHGHVAVVTLLLDDERVDPNRGSQYGNNALILAAHRGHFSVLEILLSNHRIVRTRPDEDAPNDARATYDAALFNVKYPRHARFKGLVRAVVMIRRMRLRAAEAAYAPGGAGFAAAAASFNEQQQMFINLDK